MTYGNALSLSVSFLLFFGSLLVPTSAVQLHRGGPRHWGITSGQCTRADSPDESTQAAANRLLHKLVRIHSNAYEEPSYNPPPVHCGSKAMFSSVGASADDVMPNLEIADGSVLRVRRPDLLCHLRDAVRELERAGGLSNTKYYDHAYEHSDYHSADQRKVSHHSFIYNTCPSKLKDLPRIVDGYHGFIPRSRNVTAQLPGNLRAQKDDNAFCRLSEYITTALEKQILPMFQMKEKACTVREMAVRRYFGGAYSNPHRHVADFAGALFYVDAVAGSDKLCYHNSGDSDFKRVWKEHYPLWAPDFGSDGPYSARGVDIEPGDILIAPVYWLQHWVPPVELGNGTRTAVVMAINCAE